MKFSRRTEWDLTETAWARAFARMRASRARLLDLTASNPTRCGFDYDRESILAPLANPRALEYHPNPRGSASARGAIVRYYADHGIALDAGNLLLTTSTSEAYSFLFRLLCDPGDEVLIAQPSYPLFDFLACLDDVRLVPYDLFYDHGWQADLEGLRRRIGSRTKAIVVVHPNNPTGHFTRAPARAAIETMCREHEVALIVDEVFLDYGFGQPEKSFAAGAHDAATFVLSGVSKIAALPQMKAAWIACFGEDRRLTEALARLEVIADTFLSMNAAVECALPAWLAGRAGLQRQIRERTAANLAALDGLLHRQTMVTQTMVTRLEVEAGWYALLRVPALTTGEESALRLLEQRAVAVHPGEFFGFPESGWLVISLLPVQEEFIQGMEAILDHFC